MAAPRVFISSTCYDLADERDGLDEFCNSFGFAATLSERGDIFYHPDLHTHVSCVRETSTCQMLVLIIGGRFGGKYISDKEKSVTNAEYAAAVEAKMPVFTFVKQDVLNDHNVWQRNKKSPIANEIEYPSIEKQEHAVDIFNFIELVRRAPVNNGFFGFRFAKDIQELLRKQWAGMFFDFLQSRTVASEIAVTNAALGNLSIVSNKIEELVKGIYRQVDEATANQAIRHIEEEGLAEKFLLDLSTLLADRDYIREDYWQENIENLPSYWWEFVDNFGFCTIASQEDDESKKFLISFTTERLIQVSGDMSRTERELNQKLQIGYERFSALSAETKGRLVSEYLFTIAQKDNARRTVNLRKRTRSEKVGD
jgi:hypothetical protein